MSQQQVEDELEIDPVLLKEILHAAKDGLRPDDVTYGELLHCPKCEHEFAVGPEDKV